MFCTTWYDIYAAVTTCGGIWWMKKKDPALLLAKEYREEYRQTAGSRKEQRCVDLLERGQQSLRVFVQIQP